MTWVIMTYLKFVPNISPSKALLLLLQIFIPIPWGSQEESCIKTQVQFRSQHILSNYQSGHIPRHGEQASILQVPWEAGLLVRLWTSCHLWFGSIALTLLKTKLTSSHGNHSGCWQMLWFFTLQAPGKTVLPCYLYRLAQPYSLLWWMRCENKWYMLPPGRPRTNMQ